MTNSDPPALAPGDYLARCHCGAAELAFHLSRPSPLRRCNCSLCRRRGAITASVPLGDLTVTRGGTLKLYQFNTFVAEHWFCGVCGIYTHHRRRSNPEEYGINTGCIDGIDPARLGTIPWMDGINHPSDVKR